MDARTCNGRRTSIFLVYMLAFVLLAALIAGQSVDVPVTFKVGGGNPTVTILVPVHTGTFQENTKITFVGSGTDPEDGELIGASLVWTSSVQGIIGAGRTVDTSTLMLGFHTITLTGTDSDGLTATATMIIRIAPTASAPRTGGGSGGRGSGGRRKPKEEPQPTEEPTVTEPREKETTKPAVEEKPSPVIEEVVEEEAVVSIDIPSKKLKQIPWALILILLFPLLIPAFWQIVLLWRSRQKDSAGLNIAEGAKGMYVPYSYLHEAEYIIKAIRKGKSLKRLYAKHDKFIVTHVRKALQRAAAGKIRARPRVKSAVVESEKDYLSIKAFIEGLDALAVLHYQHVPVEVPIHRKETRIEKMQEQEEYPTIHTVSDDKPKVRAFALKTKEDLEYILNALRKGDTLCLIDTSKCRKRVLKVYVNKIKSTISNIEGDIVGYGEGWILATSKMFKIQKNEQ